MLCSQKLGNNENVESSEQVYLEYYVDSCVYYRRRQRAVGIIPKVIKVGSAAQDLNLLRFIAQYQIGYLHDGDSESSSKSLNNERCYNRECIYQPANSILELRDPKISKLIGELCKANRSDELPC